MTITTRCIPVGALPYEDIDSATRMAVKLFEKMPFLPFLPKISAEDTIVNRTLSGFPGVKIVDKKIQLKVSSNHYKQGMSKLDKAFNHPNSTNLEHFSFEFFY